jgi:L-ribulose-5-phosphate 3-epimerase
MLNRRHLLQTLAATSAATTLPAAFAQLARAQAQPLFEFSLAQWSLNRMFFGGDINALDFPAFTRNEFGIAAVEYVNQFFMDKAEDSTWLAQLKQRCDDNDVTSVLIMCDREGNLGDPDAAARSTAIENHYKWANAAQFLGCHSIRVNAQSSGTWEEQQQLAADGLRRLCEYAATLGLNVIVENHGGLSSNGKWLSAVIRDVGLPNCGTLPDFGNFRITADEHYDNYLGVQELMPFAKGVSAKSYGFDAQGNESSMDYRRLLRIVLDAGYRGFVGVEWEGREPESQVEGVKLTKALLERIRDELTPLYV